MSKLYTVETFSTYQGIEVFEDIDRKQYFLSLSEDHRSKTSKRIYVTKINKPEILCEKLGMLFQERVIEGVFRKNPLSYFILKKSKSRDNSKILLSRYKHFKVLAGVAHYVIEPEAEDNFALIRIEKGTILKLYHHGSKVKIVKFNDLK